MQVSPQDINIFVEKLSYRVNTKLNPSKNRSLKVGYIIRAGID
jgi:hypothetical protein